MKLSPYMLNSVRRILSGFNGEHTTTLGDVTLPVKVGPVTQRVLFSVIEDLGPYNHSGSDLAALHEGSVINVPPNGEPFDKCRAGRSFEQPAGRTTMLSTDLA